MSPPRNFDEPEEFYSDDPVQVIGPTLRKKASGFLALLLVAIGGYFLQSTFASNISINSGRSVEFGQGVTQTVACSGSADLLVTPTSTFANAANGSGTHSFNAVTISQIPDSCFGVDFTINAYNNSDSAPLALFHSTSTNAVIYDNGGTFEVGIGGTGMSITSSPGSFKITFDTPVATSSTVYKLTIQSGLHIAIVYAPGERASGVGTVIYVSGTPFPCGATLELLCTTLEVAPSNWNATKDVSTAWCSTGAAATQNVLTGTHSTHSVIGAGLKNTITIAASCTGGAANVALAYRGAGFSDWYLPDLDEYFQMRAHYSTLGITGADYYNLSDENGPTTGVVAYLGGAGNESLAGKGSLYRVRPIRAY